nr:MAG TPA: hypothetical protein [Caudoviricetes sp.]
MINTLYHKTEKMQSSLGRGMKISGTFSVGQRPGVTCAKKAKSKG